MYRITILPGDGIGPEISESVIQLLSTLSETYNEEFDITIKDFGGASIDKYLIPLTTDTLQACKNADAIFLGAIGGEKWKPHSTLSPEAGLLQLRKELNLYTNIRPIQIFDSLIELSPLKKEYIDNVNMIIFRELTGGLYFGKKYSTENYAEDHCTYTKDEIERITKAACSFAIKNGRKKITLVDKANVLETSRFWRSIVTPFILNNYPSLKLEYQLVDSAAMKLITHPSDFDIILTENLFGDILSDEASVLAGSIGMLPSASLSDTNLGLYEPIHGSAPDIAGRNLANPYGSLLSIAMMFQLSLNRKDISDLIISAVKISLESNFVTKDLNTENYFTTREITAQVCDQLIKLKSRAKELNSFV